MKSKITRKLSSRFTKRSAKGMQYSYDPEADVLLIQLSGERPDYGEQSHNIITHYNKGGKPVEIEILDARETAFAMLKAMVAKKRAIA